MEREKFEWECAWCENPRQGPWVFQRCGLLWLPMEKSHGICGSCLERFFPSDDSLAAR